MQQNHTRNSEELWDTCLSALHEIWSKQRRNEAMLKLHQLNTAEYEALLVQACSETSVQQAWHMNWFTSAYRFGAGGVLERALAGGGADDVTALIDRRVHLGNAIISDTGFHFLRYPEGLLQWLLLVSLGRVDDSFIWGRFLFESREGSAVGSDFTGLPLDEYCRFLWCSLNGVEHNFELSGRGCYSGVLRAWGKVPELAEALRRLMDIHLKDVTKLEGAEVFYLPPFNFCPVEVLAALRILSNEELELQVAKHPLYRNPVVAAVMASKGDTHDCLRLNNWLDSKNSI